MRLFVTVTSLMIILDQADENLDRLLRDIPTKSLSNAGVQHGLERDTFSYQFQRDIEQYRPGTFILTGGVGSGKTTFLRRFSLVVNPGFLRQYCIWVQIDFLAVGNVELATQQNRISEYVYQQLRKKIESDYPDRIPESGDAIRALFAEQLERAKKTRLYEIPEGSTEWTKEVGQIVDALYTSDRDFVSALLKNLAKKGLRLVIVLDNTDQLGEEFQEQIFLFAQRLSQEHRALCIVTLREERFFAAFRRGIFDAFGDRRFHIGAPDLGRVLRKRLEYGSKKFRELVASGELILTPEELQQSRNAAWNHDSVNDTKQHQYRPNARTPILNSDMWYALDMFREFVSSGNTNVNKIFDIFEREGNYIVPFHEFAKWNNSAKKILSRESFKHCQFIQK